MINPCVIRFAASQGGKLNIFCISSTSKKNLAMGLLSVIADELVTDATVTSTPCSTPPCFLDLHTSCYA